MAMTHTSTTSPDSDTLYCVVSSPTNTPVGVGKTIVEVKQREMGMEYMKKEGKK